MKHGPSLVIRGVTDRFEQESHKLQNPPPGSGLVIVGAVAEGGAGFKAGIQQLLQVTQLRAMRGNKTRPGSE